MRAERYRWFREWPQSIGHLAPITGRTELSLCRRAIFSTPSSSPELVDVKCSTCASVARRQRLHLA